MGNQIVVQKYGGSSVADPEKLRAVARKVKARRDRGEKLVVVVSAMGDTTDELLELAKKISADPPRRELDMLLTCGERISMALLSMALHEIEVPAVSFTGSQSGIITDESHAQARVIEVRPHRIEEALADGKVVIVAGYQGVSRAREVTTLGRGGSDTTAVALAAALGADCEIYSDVDGIFSADPRVVAQAKKLETVSFDEMQELAAAGAKVLNAQAVEFAREKGIVIHARSTHAAGTGTRIETAPAPGRVKGVTCEREVWLLKAKGLSSLEPLLSWLDARQLRGRSLWFDGDEVLVLLPLQDVHGADGLRAQFPFTLAGATVELDVEVGTVTCVGTGLNSDWAVARRAEAFCAQLGFKPKVVLASSLQMTWVVPRPALEPLMRALHQELATL